MGEYFPVHSIYSYKIEKLIPSPYINTTSKGNNTARFCIQGYYKNRFGWLISNGIVFNSINYVMHEQYPHHKHNLFYWWVQLTADWLLVQTKLCTDRTTMFDEWKNHQVIHDYQNYGIFPKSILVTKYTYGNYSCSFM